MQSERKIQEINGSYLVTLPRKWADEHQLKKGSQVSVSVDGSSVKFSAGNQIHRNTKVIKFDSYVNRHFLKTYLDGFEKIEVSLDHSLTKSERESFVSFISRFMGVEIIEENSEWLVVQNLGLHSFDFNDAFEKMSSLVRCMFDDALKGNTFSLEEKDNNVNRFYFLIAAQSRLYASAGFGSISSARILDYRLAAEKIEAIGDALKRIIKISSDDSEPAGELFLFYEKAVKCFIESDFDTACTLSIDYEKLKKKIESEELKIILENCKDVSDLA